MSYPRLKVVVPNGKKQCAHSTERRAPGLRYTFGSHRCRRLVKDQGRPYEYCWQHQPLHLVRAV